MTSVGTRLTAEEFAQLPDEPDGSRMELVDGEVIVVPPPNFEHGAVSARLIGLLILAAKPNPELVVAENAGFVLRRDPDLVRAPDVAVVSQPNKRSRSSAGYLEGAPDLAIEVVSPSDTAVAIQQKVTEYLEAGAKRVWVVWPDTKSVTVHRPDGTAITHTRGAHVTADDAGLALDEFSIAVAGLFA